jgi:hypothetical protein
MTHPLVEEMMKAAAIAARAAEPVPWIPVVTSGTSADDAWATIATEMNRRSAKKAAHFARKASEVEALILDGTLPEESDENS